MHVLLWAVFLSLPTLFNPRRMDEGLEKFVFDLLEPPRWSNGILFILVFYVNSYIIIPRLYFRRRYMALVGTVVLFFGLFFCLNNYHAHHMASFHEGPPGGMPPEMRHPHVLNLGNSFNLFMFIIAYACSFTISLYKQYRHIKEETLTARISFLTAQINPHFLFNTLNSIYSLSLSRSDKTPGAIVKLSGMMRYAVDEGAQSRVALHKEIGYIKNYIELQQLRLTEEVTVSVDITGEPGNAEVAPFILIPFVENAFKHGVNGTDPSQIALQVHMSESELRFMVSNTRVTTRADRDTGVGLGIDTTRQRLQLLYPGEHSLHINENSDKFTVSLHIQF